MNHSLPTLALGALLSFAPLAFANDAIPNLEHVQIADGLARDEADRLLETARQYYGFWNTGSEDYAKRALSPDFVDLNLPAGRPQGPTGPLVASVAFRQAVPDLSLTVKSVYVLRDKVIGQLQFDGHFGEREGKGQAISFSAVDMYTIKKGQITENWHLEDNLTLMQQLGAID